MHKNKILIGTGITLMIILIIYVFSSSSDTETNLIVEVEQGEFVVDIMTSGALEAKNSVKIKGPNGLRRTESGTLPFRIS